MRRERDINRRGEIGKSKICLMRPTSCQVASLLIDREGNARRKEQVNNSSC